MPVNRKKPGENPEENAVIKARYYGRFFDTVICNDSGLYFDKLPPDDERPAGLTYPDAAGEPPP